MASNTSTRFPYSIYHPKTSIPHLPGSLTKFILNLKLWINHGTTQTTLATQNAADVVSCQVTQPGTKLFHFVCPSTVRVPTRPVVPASSNITGTEITRDIVKYNTYVRTRTYAVPRGARGSKPLHSHKKFNFQYFLTFQKMFII